MFIIRRVKNRKNRKITFGRKHSAQTFIGELYRVVLLGQDEPKKKGSSCMTVGIRSRHNLI